VAAVPARKKHWIVGDLLLWDTETDHEDPQAAQLIQTALIHISDGQRQLARSWMVKPRRPIPEGAVGAHGITTERAEAEGEPVEQVLDELCGLLERHWTPRTVLIGANVCYDLTVLDRELGRVFGSDRALVCGGPVVDTLLLDKRCDRYRPGSRKLADQCAYYGLELVNAHDAFADALACGQLAWKIAIRCIKNRWPRGQYPPHHTERHARGLVANGDPRLLHAAQVSWHEEGQRGLAEYWRSPKCVQKLWERQRAGEFTVDEVKARIAALPEMAAQVEALASGCWPLIPRMLVTA
jgi:DNA polymerase III subunit epsilon